MSYGHLLHRVVDLSCVTCRNLAAPSWSAVPKSRSFQPLPTYVWVHVLHSWWSWGESNSRPNNLLSTSYHNSKIYARNIIANNNPVPNTVTNSHNRKRAHIVFNSQPNPSVKTSSVVASVIFLAIIPYSQ
jgi:hypothetical protein